MLALPEPCKCAQEWFGLNSENLIIIWEHQTRSGGANGESRFANSSANTKLF